MNFKDLLYEIALTELGETTDAYNWYKQEVQYDEATFIFNAEDIKYEAVFEAHDGQIDVDFAPVYGQVEPDDFKTRYSTTTGEGNQFQIMATVLQIAKHVWERKEEIFEADGLNVFKFYATGDKEGNRRAKLYKTFIKKQFPSAKIQKIGPKSFKVIP